MTRIQRQIFTRGAIVGALITVIVIAADIAGVLSPVENWFYDFRARHFQFATEKPANQLVHVDIDDKALDITGVGTWPWPRAKLAGILDELRIAGVKAVALDVLYSEPQDEELPTTQPGTGSLASNSNDTALATAIRKLGNVVVPAAVPFESSHQSPLSKAMFEELKNDPELEEAELARRLSNGPLADKELARNVAENLVVVRKQAMAARIAQELTAGSKPRDELRSMLLKSKDVMTSTPVSRVFDQQFNRQDAIAALDRLGAPIPAEAPALAKVDIHLTPIPVLAHAAAGTGYVDYKTARDGVLRSVPLLANHNNRLIPQMGLSLAMLTLGIKPQDLKIASRSITIPAPDGTQIVIPTYGEYAPALEQQINSIFDIPWFGGSRWQEMYDWPTHQRTAQHMGITILWSACDTQRKIAKNNANAVQALRDLREHWGISFSENPRNIDDADAYKPDAERVINDLKDYEQMLIQLKPQEVDEKGYKLLDAVKALRFVTTENPKLAIQLREQREFLASQLAGKSVLIGWAATAQLADMIPTSLHARCPGVVAHGVIFNAIMTRSFWTRLPPWMAALITLVLGLLVALAASWFSPLLGLVLTVLLGFGYIFLNGYILFDLQNYIVGMAGPLTVLATVWAGCTLNRIIIEMSERNRITSRFGSYVDPTLLSHVLDNPDQVRFEGETRELTVVFTDLAGFTTLSEKLGEATVPLLNEYLGRMVPIISSQGGYVNKFLGDGIMFFFGAPIPKSNHAQQAVASVLEMQRAMDDFNRELVNRGLPSLSMRAGISTGMMVVGDAGTTDRSDYTVLGDIVNLGARLEGANKATGTKILLNDRTAELIREQYLLRPIGALQVKGKAIWVMTYEPIAPIKEATEQQKKLVELTGAVVDAFIPGDFEGCLVAADKLEAEFGPSPLAAIYREQSRNNIANPPEAFDGRIELTEK